MTDFNSYCPNKKYDLIVSNPPFFKDGVLAPKHSRQVARHMTGLRIDHLIEHALSMLADGGKLCMITPTEINDDVMRLCDSISAFVGEKTMVYTKVGAKPKRILWQIQRTPCETNISELYIHNEEGRYTSAYTDLCRDFYLQM